MIKYYYLFLGKHKRHHMNKIELSYSSRNFSGSPRVTFSQNTDSSPSKEVYQKYQNSEEVSSTSKTVITSKLNFSAKTFIPFSNSLTPKSSITTSSIGQTSTVGSLEKDLVLLEKQIPPPQDCNLITLDTLSLEAKTLYAIYISTSNSPAALSFNYNNKILSKYSESRSRPKNDASKFFHFQLDNKANIWFEEIHKSKPLLWYNSDGNFNFVKVKYITLDNRRNKYHLKWDAKSSLTLSYEIWKMDANLKRDKKVFCSNYLSKIKSRYDSADKTSDKPESRLEYLTKKIISDKPYRILAHGYLSYETELIDLLESRPAIHPEEFQKLISYNFKNAKLLDLVLNHNLIREKPEREYTNFEQERLEFLGNSILEFVIAKFCYENPSLKLTRFYLDDLLKNKSGIKYLTKLGIFKFTKLSGINPTMQSENLSNIKAYMDLFEVLIGAIYLDSDIGSVEKFYLRHFQNDCNETCQISISKMNNDNKNEDLTILENSTSYELKKLAAFSSNITLTLIEIFVYRHFPKADPFQLTSKSAVLYALSPLSADEIGKIYLEKGIQEIQSIMHKACADIINEHLQIWNLQEKTNECQFIQGGSK